jgi:hypothetical protein
MKVATARRMYGRRREVDKNAAGLRGSNPQSLPGFIIQLRRKEKQQTHIQLCGENTLF